MSDLAALLLRYGHHDETCASVYAPALDRPCNCGLEEVMWRLDPPEQRYQNALSAGLSDAEAREEGWPSDLEAAGVRVGDAGLDVERLARALVIAVRSERAPIGGRGDGWPAYVERGLPATVLNVDLLARAIAREYAALAEEPGR